MMSPSPWLLFQAVLRHALAVRLPKRKVCRSCPLHVGNIIAESPWRGTVLVAFETFFGANWIFCCTGINKQHGNFSVRQFKLPFSWWAIHTRRNPAPMMCHHLLQCRESQCFPPTKLEIKSKQCLASSLSSSSPLHRAASLRMSLLKEMITL